ncbi:MAG: sigma 54-interacting transcriptional regulator [Thermodesulfobacteriota bacterium]
MTGKVSILSEDNNLANEIKDIVGRDSVEVFTRSEDIKDADVVLLDIDTTGINRLNELKDKYFVIVITAEKGTRYLIESMTFGAFDCVFRPLKNSTLVSSLERALGIKSELKGSVVEFHGRAPGTSVTCAIVGDSPILQEVCKLIGQVGRVDVPILITGESGTGKELVAESVWKVSTRWEKPFVVLNCAAIPESLLEAELFGYEKGAFTGADASRTGKFEEADGGIIFLDEIGDMPFSLQAKVLRVLQSGTFHRLGSNKEITVDVRIIAATNKDLEKMVMEGQFREDLYFRINVVRIHLPALKERKEDVPLLSECFTRRHGSQIGKEIKGFTDKFQKMLMEYDWPGNVRELENVIRKAIAFTKTTYLTSYDLNLSGRRNLSKSKETISLKDALRTSVKSLLSSGQDANIYDMVVKEAELVLLQEALDASGWNRSKAARTLGINRLTLRRKLEEYGIGERRGSGEAV